MEKKIGQPDEMPFAGPQIRPPRAVPKKAFTTNAALVSIAQFGKRSPLTRIAFTLAVVLVALLLRIVVFGGLGSGLVYVTFFPAIAIAALFGGFSCGILSIVLSAVLAHLLIGPVADGTSLIGLSALAVSGSIIAGMAHLLHISQAKLSEDESVRRSEIEMRALIDHAPVAIAMFDRQMRYLAASRKWSSDYNIETDLVGRSHYEIFPDIPDQWKDIHKRAMAGETLGADEDPFPRADGSTQWLKWNVRPWHHPLDGIGGVLIYSEDVTARMENDAALKLSEERFRLITQASNNAIWDWDLQTNDVWWNDGLRRVFGYDPADFAHGPDAWMSHVDPSDRDRVEQTHEPALNGSQPGWTCEYKFQRGDGSLANVLVRGVVVRDDGGKPQRVMGSVTDITTQTELDAQLRQAQKLESVGHLTGGVAHDFNNLLLVILGCAEELADSLGHDPRLRSLARMTMTAAESGAELTRSLLSFARRQPLDPKPTEIDKLLANTDTLLRRTLAEDIELEIVRSGGLWRAIIDPGQLEAAVLNLVLNARDAMPDGGRLTIETSNAALDDRYAAQHDEVAAGQYVLVSISDTGTGMSAETLARAYEPFFTTKEIGKGSGLGLSMVYGFIKQSKGHLKIYSEIGHGTTVKLYLPRAPGAASPSAADQPPQTYPGSETILLVEDDSLVRSFASELLRNLGYRVIAATNGPEALRVLEATPSVDLLFTDVVMPGGMSGRNLADSAQQLRPDLRVLFTSGYTENAVVHHGRLDRGVHLLSKPYRKQELAAKIRLALEEKSGSSKIGGA